MDPVIVRVVSLKKSYGPVRALDGISFEVGRGRIFGLLGPNGAGKTTAVRILTTLTRPDDGTAEIAGADVLANPAKVRSLIGYVPQELTVDPYLTAAEHLRYYADLYHLAGAAWETRTRELLALLGLAGQEGRRVRHFSGGMKKKLDLACGFLHRPPLMVLDEPSLGLDVQVRHDVWRYIEQLRDQGTTVFLCTNYMDEAERLCDEVAIIDRGRIAALGTPAALRSNLKRDVISVEVSASHDHHAEKLAALERAVAGLDLVRETMKDGTQLKIYVEQNELALPQILSSAAALSVPIHAISYSRPGLDEVFLHYTGHSFAEGNEHHG
ncbi:MAG: ATP-binding cassette domain-containing protein [Deltaproteobacteria bacterium]|nr:ATP-binding cassette domain-containing protein [Deltaproteobacteria bacterium]